VDEALAEARAGGFRFSITVANSSLLPNLGSGFNGFVVIRQRPLAGATVPRGTVLHLLLAESFNGGFDQVDALGAVPDLVGVPIDAAMHQAYSSGLRVTLSFARMPLADLPVSNQSVVAGARVSRGELITLRVG
jgi:beta-lactam-binding protein with PASTA domain